MSVSSDHLEIINEVAARLFEKIQEQFTVMPTLKSSVPFELYKLEKNIFKEHLEIM